MNKAVSPSLKFIIISIIIFLFSFSAFCFLFIKNLTEPLAGGSDIDIWEYIGFYLKENLSFSPLPTLNLNNNYVFYPYGTTSVFQPWALERDIFYATFYSLFGSGSWLKIYYLITIALTAFGSFILLFKDYGYGRAMGFGYLVTFCNFYAIMEYPVHISKAVLHWTTLSFIIDFLIVKKLVLGHYISLRLILVRFCLLFLSLGQDIGYIAGFALTSFTISALFIILLFGYRYFKGTFRLKHLFNVLNLYRHELYTNSWISFVLINLSLLACYIYIPLIWQIFKSAKRFDFTNVANSGLWIHPLRLFIPFLPEFNPAQPVFKELFNDLPENIGAGSPGWFLLILAILGIWKTRKQIAIYIPLIIIFFLFVFYHPTNFPTLNIFPWFAFNRKPVTSIYPVILCLFALGINFKKVRLLKKQYLSIFIVLIIFLGCIELYTAYKIKLSYNNYLVDTKFSFKKSFFTYMDYLKQQPGEAILDWPFCVVGGNGVGAENLCPYYKLTSGNFALRRFHTKKVIGQYFGRLHPSQIEAYIQAGWDKLFSPNSPDIMKATHQTRCFIPNEWSFFTYFFKLNDFAGINLYVDLLPENCVQEFYKRFGNPVLETIVPGAGKVKFIPKSPDIFNQVNLALGIELKYEPFLDLSDSNLIKNNLPYGLTIKGLSYIETDNQLNSWRWALGPETSLKFNLAKSQILNFNFKFINPIVIQNINLEINGIIVDTMNNLKENDSVEKNITFQGIQGWNQIIFTYKDWNKNNTKFATQDERPMAINFQKLTISASE
ncbi:MAG: hypothetical protein KME28_01575 [Pelatocladus maniniholoensis HA4357-MV3]|jgi:hypothetical protein|uniref:Uncharacterized protein n=1 Tax=Pelatocladus maniniholoensis HA4357-MV3 TaxID=1117104 RepID=A0A9E3H3U5_9NOST|nr:hypothetical protein [Pelatocladus maniniholoensis HA4357-MV3]BAZ70141.1 hypothetical protein NIES4106_49280 [Fischerella sp. NIES-4106]